LSRGPACGDATVETRKAADSADLDTCHKLFGGCGQAADTMCRLLANCNAEAAQSLRERGKPFPNAGGGAGEGNSSVGLFMGIGRVLLIVFYCIAALARVRISVLKT